MWIFFYIHNIKTPQYYPCWAKNSSTLTKTDTISERDDENVFSRDQFRQNFAEDDNINYRISNIIKSINRISELYYL